jgi:uncharacterized protein YheU (UPF0270 family)
MIIPFQDVQSESLQVILEDWLTRQSQEWLGDSEERKQAVEKVLVALKSKQLFITWDEEMNSLDMIGADQLADLNADSDTEELNSNTDFET